MDNWYERGGVGQCKSNPPPPELASQPPNIADLGIDYSSSAAMIQPSSSKAGVKVFTL